MDLIDCTLYTDKPFPTLRMSGRVLVLYRFMGEVLGLTEVYPFESKETLSNLLTLAQASGYTQIIFNIELNDGETYPQLVLRTVEALQWANETHPAMPIGVYGCPNALSVGPGSTQQDIQAVNDLFAAVFAQPNLRIAVPCLYTRHDIATGPGWALWVADVDRALAERARCCPRAAIMAFTRPRYDDFGWYADPQNPKIGTFMESPLYRNQCEYLSLRMPNIVWSGPEAWGDAPQTWWHDLLSASKLQPDITSGLAKHYTFAAASVSGTTIADQSGNVRNATSSGSPTFSEGPVPGGRWCTFNGTNQWLDAGAALSGQSNALSVAFWVLPNAWADFCAMCSNTSSDGSSYMYAMLKKDGTNNPYAFDGTHFTRFGGIVKSGLRRHVVFTSTQGVVNIYCDGQLVMTDGGFNNPLASGGNDYIGCVGAGVSNFFKGSIADWRLYTRVLDQTDIETLFRLGQPGKRVVEILVARELTAQRFPANIASDVLVEVWSGGGSGSDLSAGSSKGGGASAVATYLLAKATALAHTWDLDAAISSDALADGYLSTFKQHGGATLCSADPGKANGDGGAEASCVGDHNRKGGDGASSANGGAGGGSAKVSDFFLGVVERDAVTNSPGTGEGDGGYITVGPISHDPSTPGGGGYGAPLTGLYGVGAAGKVKLTYYLPVPSAVGFHPHQGWKPWLIAG